MTVVLLGESAAVGDAAILPSHEPLLCGQRGHFDRDPARAGRGGGCSTDTGWGIKWFITFQKRFCVFLFARMGYCTLLI